MKAIDIRTRFDSLTSVRKTLDDTLQAIEKFVVPYRGEFFKPLTSELEVEWRRRKIYDSTAIISCNLLASQIHANLTSPSIRWFELRWRDDELNANHAASEWIEATQRKIWNTLLDSDFNMEIAESYLELCSFGTTVLFEEELDERTWKGVNFTAFPIMDCYFEYGADDRLLRVYRRIRYTMLQLKDKFPNLPDKYLAGLEESKDVDNKMEVIFCVYLREDKQDADITKRLAPKNRPYGFKYVMHSDAEELQEGGYYEMPAFAARWQKVAGSRWGRSPAFTCLSDVLQLNEVVAQTSESRAKAIDPPIITTERGILSDLDLTPGGLTTVMAMDELGPLLTGARFDQADAEIERLQQAIRSTFHIDKLELKESPAMTATEVMVRQDRMQRSFAPTLGRLQADMLDPLIKKTFAILLRAGQLPPVPEIAMGAEMDVEYVGPIPRAQKNEVAQASSMWIGELAALSEVIPEILDVVDVDALAVELGKMRGVPVSMMRNEDEIKAVREERAAAAQKQTEMANMETMGKAMPGIAQGAEMMGQEGNA